MQINTLPTDNLYKFCALLGLSLIIFNTYYNFEMSYNSKVKVINLESEYKKFQYDSIVYVRHSEEINEKMKSALKSNKQISGSETIIMKAFHGEKLTKNEQRKLDEIMVLTPLNEENNQEIEELLKANSDENRKLNFKAYELQATTRLIGDEKEKCKYYSYFLWSGAVIGLILSIYGFINWAKGQAKLDQSQ